MELDIECAPDVLREISVKDKGDKEQDRVKE
jgi:hypothetical protein